MKAISLAWQPDGAFHQGFVAASTPNSVPDFASILHAD